MKITGIITEYNPMHNGHMLHLEKTKSTLKSDAIVCIMSGNFVQRGLPAIVDKWSRAKMAIENGVDLVLELPVIYSVSSAEHFAFGSVSILNSLNIVDSLCFGSECGNINLLYEIAKILVEEPEPYKISLKEHLKNGVSFPKARTFALSSYFDNMPEIDAVLNSSNNILGIEYIKSLLRLNSTITPYTITREGSNYNDKNFTTKYSSATSIREFIFNTNANYSLEKLKEFMPDNNVNLFQECILNGNIANPDNMLPYLKYKALTQADTITNLPDVKEGLHNSLIKSLKECLNFNEVINSSKSKRYTYTRLSRILCQYFLGLEKYDLQHLLKQPPTYARALGFNNTGKEVLSLLKKSSSIPIYTNINKSHTKNLEIDINSTACYSLLNRKINYNDDFFKRPIIKL